MAEQITNSIPARVFNRQTQDVAVENRQTARYIGNLIQGTTRLNVNSALTTKDNADMFRFTVYQKQATGFGMSITVPSESPIKVELLDKAGRTIADSTAVAGDLADNWQKIQASSMQLDTGDYFVKISRPETASTPERYQYFLQVRTGFEYKQDFDTTETPQSVTRPYVTNNFNSVKTMLLGGYNGGAIMDYSSALFGTAESIFNIKA